MPVTIRRVAFVAFLIVSTIVLTTMAATAWMIYKAGREAERSRAAIPAATVTPAVTATPAASKPLPAPSVSPTVSPVPVPAPVLSASLNSLLIPVQGIRGSQLHDTFNEARSEARVHEAIDIIAPRGSRVLAAADGTVVRLFNSDKGGLTIYQISPDEKHVFYYAHLEGYLGGLTEKQQVRQGDVIGYVGDTGNAQPGNYHLHFAIWQISDPKVFWNGSNVNPYPLLHNAQSKP